MKDTWHIYYATHGTNGAYIDALLTASRIAGVRVRAFVSAYYRFNSGRLTKCFFPITDRSDYRSSVVLFLRGAELAIAYVMILAWASMARPRIVIHLIDDLPLTTWFMSVCQFIGLEVWITCHDVGS
ncbi:MAG: hypothetical protein V3T31_02645, partial [candidate division Zixibacteria bacterium]